MLFGAAAGLLGSVLGLAVCAVGEFDLVVAAWRLSCWRCWAWACVGACCCLGLVCAW